MGAYGGAAAGMSGPMDVGTLLDDLADATPWSFQADPIDSGLVEADPFTGSSSAHIAAASCRGARTAVTLAIPEDAEAIRFSIRGSFPGSVTMATGLSEYSSSVPRTDGTYTICVPDGFAGTSATFWLYLQTWGNCGSAPRVDVYLDDVVSTTDATGCLPLEIDI